jgi:NB-ARC domain
MRRQQSWREETKVPRLEITIIDETIPSNGLGDTVHRLHWEVLEDKRLWPEFNFVITIRRLMSVNVDAIYTLGSVRSRPHAQSDPKSTFNIPLAVARDLSEDADLYEEVSPTLASQILLEIGSEVSKIREDLHIQIEIVRPGTLQVLEKYLLAHPPGYFQLAHFDTHGRVAKDRTTKTKQAYLLFDSAKPSGKLLSFRASTIGHLLAKRGMRLSTLNSCTLREQVTKLVGRDFDLLRFERALFEYGVICLSGAAGVGKSAFIQTALETWSRTNFCHTILVVNLVSLESRIPESLARHILGVLVDEDAEEIIIARVAESEEEQGLQRALIDILRSRRSVLIFDNLHFTHCGLPARYLASSLGDAEQKDIADFLAQMAIASTNLASEGEIDIPVRLVLISRVSIAQD